MRAVPNEVSLPLQIGRWLAVLLHLVVGFFYLASGLLAPLWAVAGLAIIWIVLAALAVWQWRTRPGWVIATPFCAAAIWFTVLWLGDVFLGWTP
jgi:hypothetical protein